MEWVKDRTDIKSANGEVGRPWIKFNVTRKEKKDKKKMTAKARGAWASEQEESSWRDMSQVTILLGCSEVWRAANWVRMIHEVKRGAVMQ